MLDEDQQTAFDLAKDGHNLVVIGQGGCGKTFLIKQIVNYLRSKGKNVTIACSMIEINIFSEATHFLT
jgi:GTPase SAR1 family protein